MYVSPELVTRVQIMPFMVIMMCHGTSPGVLVVKKGRQKDCCHDCPSFHALFRI